MFTHIHTHSYSHNLHTQQALWTGWHITGRLEGNIIAGRKGEASNTMILHYPCNIFPHFQY